MPRNVFTGSRDCYEAGSLCLFDLSHTNVIVHLLALQIYGESLLSLLSFYFYISKNVKGKEDREVEGEEERESRRKVWNTSLYTFCFLFGKIFI